LLISITFSFLLSLIWLYIHYITGGDFCQEVLAILFLSKNRTKTEQARRHTFSSAARAAAHFRGTGAAARSRKEGFFALSS